MKWTSFAIDKLKSYNAKKQAIESIPNEIKRLESRVDCVRSPATDAVSVMGGQNSSEDALLANIVLREELAERLKDAQRWVDGVDNALSVLSEEEMLVLDKFYINWRQGNIQQLCYELHVEQSTVYRRRDDALRHFTTAFYGTCES